LRKLWLNHGLARARPNLLIFFWLPAQFLSAKPRVGCPLSTIYVNWAKRPIGLRG
jgi:hypothetical protein